MLETSPAPTTTTSATTTRPNGERLCLKRPILGSPPRAHECVSLPFRFGSGMVSRKPASRTVVGARRRDYRDEVDRSQGADRHSWFQTAPETSLAMIERAGLVCGDAVLDVGPGASALVGLGPGPRIEDERRETHPTPAGGFRRLISIRARLEPDPHSVAAPRR